MITMRYEVLMLIMAIELIVILLVQWLHRDSKRGEIIKCQYEVISKKTGYYYDCIAIRENEEYIYEIQIYNYFTGDNEWHPYNNFIFLSK